MECDRKFDAERGVWITYVPQPTEDEIQAIRVVAGLTDTILNHTHIALPPGTETYGHAHRVPPLPAG